MQLDEVTARLAGAVDVLREHHVEALYIFGSVARGEATETSDVDLLVDFAETPSLFDFARLRRALSESFGCQVDLVTRPDLKPELRDSIRAETIRAA